MLRQKEHALLGKMSSRVSKIQKMAFRGRFVLNMIYFASKRGAKKDDLIRLSGCAEDELTKENTSISDHAYNLSLIHI